MTREAVETSEVESSNGALLDLKLWRDNDSQRESKIELDLLTPMNPTSPPEKAFICSYCKRVYSSSQALGGHQNAHKKERALAKRGSQQNSISPPRFPYYPYSTISSNPFYEPFNRSALRVRLESMMIHKPSYPWIPYGSGGHRLPYGLYRQAMMNYPRPGFNEGTSINPSNSSRVGSLASFAANSQANVAVNGPAESNGYKEDGSGIDLSLRL